MENKQSPQLNDSLKNAINKDLKLLHSELDSKHAYPKLLQKLNLQKSLSYASFNEKAVDRIQVYLDTLSLRFQERLNEASKDRERLIDIIKTKRDSTYDINQYKNKYFNEGQAIFVTNGTIQERIVEHKGRLLQQIDPIYQEPSLADNPLNYRTHFMAPKKHILAA
ncbi:MAG: hypothetical protein HC880_01760 [Bacteroidia bacterium]|nr:hypothetical protein [Bacteroidia bacterium]